MSECDHTPGRWEQAVPGWVTSVCTKCGKQISRRITAEDNPVNLMLGDQWPERPALIRKPLELSAFEAAVYDQMPSLVNELATALQVFEVLDCRLADHVNARFQARTILTILKDLIPKFSPDPGWENSEPPDKLVSELLEKLQALNEYIEKHGIDPADS